MKRFLVVASLIALTACAAPVIADTTTTTIAEKKVFVCKYVGTPGIDERLQNGDNPISVSVNAIPLGDVQVGSEFADTQGRSLVIAFDTGQPEPDCPAPHGGTTTTTTGVTTSTTTTSPTTTSMSTTTSTASPTTTTTNPCPAPPCIPNTQGATTTTSPTTSSSAAPTTTTSSPQSSTPTTTSLFTTPPTTSSSTSSSTTLPETFTFGAAATVCVAEVPTISISFVTPAQFPELVGQTGTLTMTDVNGNVVSTQPLVYQPGSTVQILYPGTRVNPDGTIADVPGWTLQSNGLWVRDPSDEYLREGILLTYELNPTATAFITYPPESSACANPDNPPATPPAGGELPPTQ